MIKITKSLQSQILIICLLLTFTVTAQVGIGTTLPAGGSLLDLNSATKGFLVPRVNIQNLTTIAPVTGGATVGLLVWNTRVATGVGYHYWDGNDWIPLGGSTPSNDWNLAGNLITGTEVLGTMSNHDLNIVTNTVQRMKVFVAGQVSVNLPVLNFAGDIFSAEGAYAVNGYSTGGGGIGVYGEAAGAGVGVWGNSVDAQGVLGVSANDVGVHGQGVLGMLGDGGIGVWGNGTSNGVVGDVTAGVGAQGQATTGDGVRGFSDSADGVYGETLTGIGVNGAAFDNAAFAGRFFNSGADSDGVHIGGSNSGPWGIVGNNLGVTATALDFGAVGFGDDLLGTGVVGVGNFLPSLVTNINGSGLAGTGFEIGVYGHAIDFGSDAWGGYFVNDIYGGSAGVVYSYVGGWQGLTQRKILGNGSVSTIVKDVNDNLITLTCPESPEILFQDYGIGELTNGSARINIDPNFAKNIRVDAEHPMKVFVQLEGDCNGVYVTNKSANGFDVKELQRGNSNVSFSWSIVATRADEEFIMPDGSIRLSQNGLRFQPAPGPLEVKASKKEKIDISKKAKTKIERNSNGSEPFTKKEKIKFNKE